MQLQSKQAIGPAGLLVIVNQLGRLHPIDVMNKMKALAGNPVSVPFSLFNRFADFLGVPEGGCLLLKLTLVVNRKNGLLPPGGEDSAESFTITNARPPVSGLKVGLIATDTPPVMLPRFDETPVLNAGITRLDLKIEMQVKILHFQILADKKGISLGRILLCRLTENGPVLHTPKLGITVPSLQGFPIEEIFFRVNGGARKGKKREEECKRFHFLIKRVSKQMSCQPPFRQGKVDGGLFLFLNEHPKPSL